MTERPGRLRQRLHGILIALRWSPRPAPQAPPATDITDADDDVSGHLLSRDPVASHRTARSTGPSPGRQPRAPRAP
jgi:hypothetical protein